MKNRKLAILWDLDGTIIDSKECHYRSWKAVFTKHGYPFRRAAYEDNFGRNNQAALRIYLGFEPERALEEAILEEKEVIFRERVVEEGQLVIGVRDWLEAARKHTFPQVIASSAPMENIQAVLEGFGLMRYFEALISGAALPAKPRPDVFLKASQKVGCPPGRCLVIEDSIHGVGAAKNAGMPCIAVSTSGNAMALNAADLVVADFSIPLDQALSSVFS